MRRPKLSSGSSPHFGTHQPSAAEPKPRQQNEWPVGPGLAKDTKITHLERLPDEKREALAQQLGDPRALRRIGDAASERQMKAPLVEDVGVAPALQKLVLARRQARGAPARQLLLAGWPAQAVEFDDALVGQNLQLGRRCCEHQRQKARQFGKHQRRRGERALAIGKAADSLEQVALARTVGERHGRLQGGMKAVAAWLGGDVGQPFRFGQRRTAEPPARHRRQRLLRPWRIVERIARCHAIAAPCLPISAKRSLPETKSMAATTTRIISTMKETCCSSSVRIASARCKPMPPAPTMPMIVADRVLDSK